MALSTAGFDWKRILLYSVIITLALILVHALIYLSGALESPWGPVKVLFAEYFVMIILAFIAISKMKKAREAPFAFFDVFIHVLAMAMFVLLLYTTYDYVFSTRIDPEMNIRITQLQVQEAETTLAEAAEFEANGDTLHSESSKEQMRELIDNGEESIKELKGSTPGYIQILQGNVTFFMLLFGLFWGLILAVIHRERVISAS